MESRLLERWRALSNATFKRYAHGDLKKLETLLNNTENGGPGKLIVTDAVFSMDGDVADRYLRWSRLRKKARCIVDPRRRTRLRRARLSRSRVLEHFNIDLKAHANRIVYMATLGKAMGGYGAVRGGATDTIEWVLQSARSYLFTTATPPAITAAMQASLDILGRTRPASRTCGR